MGVDNASLSEQEEYPLITICMPIRNREWCLNYVLKAIENLDYPSKRIKLVFIDNYSTDATFEILSRWKTMKKDLYYDVVLTLERGNIPHLRNLCIKYSEGKYMLFWDSDMVPPRDLVKRMVGLMEHDNKVGMIGALWVPMRIDKLRSIDISTWLTSKSIKYKKTHAMGTGFTLVRREVFEKVGVFNELLDIGEDTEFSIRVFEKGYKILRVLEPVLHLQNIYEDRFIVRPSQGLLRWLKYNFHVRGEKYAKSFCKLPMLLKLRILYYALLPPVLFFTILLALYKGMIWVLLIPITYLSPGLFLTINDSGIKAGIVIFFKFNIPTGIALSYGTLTHAFKEFLKRLVGR